MVANFRPDKLSILVLTETTTTPAYLSELARSGTYRLLGRERLTTAIAVSAVRDRVADVVIADVATFNGLRPLADLVGASDAVGFVVVSSLPPEVVFFAGIAARARGFVQKPVPLGLLDQAVAAVAAGWTYVDPRVTGWLVELVMHSHLARSAQGLSLRQSQVLLLVRNGLTNKQIGAVLGVSAETVKSHVQEAMRKLGVRDRREAAALLGGEAAGRDPPRAAEAPIPQCRTGG